MEVSVSPQKYSFSTPTVSDRHGNILFCCISLKIDVDITKYDKEQTTEQLNEFITEAFGYFDECSSKFQ